MRRPSSRRTSCTTWRRSASTSPRCGLARASRGPPPRSPVLLAHLNRDRPTSLLDGIGVALSHKAVRPWWPDLVRLYESDKREVVRERLAAALATIAVREHHDDLLRLFSDSALGPSRVLLVRPLHRTGNRVEKGLGRAEIEPWADDPVVGSEVRAVLAGRSRSH